MISPCIITTMDDLKSMEGITGEATAGETTVITYKKSEFFTQASGDNLFSEAYLLKL